MSMANCDPFFESKLTPLCQDTWGRGMAEVLLGPGAAASGRLGNAHMPRTSLAIAHMHRGYTKRHD
jgi:hypothetical protein